MRPLRFALALFQYVGLRLVLHLLDLSYLRDTAPPASSRRSSLRTDPPKDPPGEADSSEDTPPGGGFPEPSSGDSSAGSSAVADTLPPPPSTGAWWFVGCECGHAHGAHTEYSAMRGNCDACTVCACRVFRARAKDCDACRGENPRCGPMSLCGHCNSSPEQRARVRALRSPCDPLKLAELAALDSGVVPPDGGAS